MSTQRTTPQRARTALSIVSIAAMMLTVLFATAGTADAQQESNYWTGLAGTAACIEGPVVQDDPAAAHLSVGQTFVGKDGNRFTITYGGPTCSFTGAGCDGQMHVVADVKACLASQHGAAVGVATDTASEGPIRTLAYTGSDEVLAMLGATLLGAGALLEAGRRRRERI